MATKNDVHTPRRGPPDLPAGWALYLSSESARRLVVFVHGFGGRAVSTWNEFATNGRVGPWWRQADMLFVGYDSFETIVGIAGRVRDALPRFYPLVPERLLAADGMRLRPHECYEELVLVGHSLGGVILRRMLSDVAQEWIDARAADPSASRPPLLDARTYLFSPASAGFRAAGWLGMTQASRFWSVANMVLRRASAYTDLQPGSTLLLETQRRTEALVRSDGATFQALKARILWANPDNVVHSERYESDYVDAVAHGRTHRSVCKPSASYTGPWTFVETGRWA